MSDATRGGGPKRVVDDRIAEWVDGCLSDRDRERFTAELRVNPQLRKDLEEYERTVATVRAALRAPIGPVNLADRVIEAIGKPVVVTRPVRFRPRWQSMVWSLAAAAALLSFAVWLNGWEGKPAAVLTTDQAGVPMQATRGQDDAVPTGSREREKAGPETAGADRELPEATTLAASAASDPTSKKVADPANPSPDPLLSAKPGENPVEPGGAAERLGIEEVKAEAQRDRRKEASEPPGEKRTAVPEAANDRHVADRASKVVEPESVATMDRAPGARGSNEGRVGAPARGAIGGASGPVRPAAASAPVPEVMITASRSKLVPAPAPAAPSAAKDKSASPKDVDPKVLGEQPGFPALAAEPYLGAFLLAQFAPLPGALAARTSEVSETSVGELQVPFFDKTPYSYQTLFFYQALGSEALAPQALIAEPLAPVAPRPAGSVDGDGPSRSELVNADSLAGVKAGGVGGGAASPRQVPVGSTERVWIVEGDRAEVFDFLRRIAELARKQGFQLTNGELAADAPELSQLETLRRPHSKTAGAPTSAADPSPAAPPTGRSGAGQAKARDLTSDGAPAVTRIVLRFRTLP